MSPSSRFTLAADAAPVRWTTTVRPYRSMNHTPLMLIAVMLGGSSIVAAVAFSAVGAWPVFGFLGLDVLLLYAAIRLNLKRAGQLERFTLTDEELLIERVDPWGRHRQWSVPPHWLRVRVAKPVRSQPQVELHTHGRMWVIAKFLHPAQQAELADAIRDAVAQLKAPPGDRRSFTD